MPYYIGANQLAGGRFRFLAFLHASQSPYNCLCVGEKCFDAGFGASIYYNTKNQQLSGHQWQFLGVLSNEKPSAVFRVQQAQNQSVMDADSMQMMAEQPESSDDDYGEIGISIEPLTMLELLVSSKTADKAESYQVSKNQQYLAVAIERLAENMFNYLSSFAKPASGYLELSEPVVPVKTLQDWYNNVTRRLSRDPTWLSSMSK